MRATHLLAVIITLTLVTHPAFGGITVENPKGVSGQGLSPLQITGTVKKSLEKVRNACVSVNGAASGVVISPDGYVLTAGHVAGSALKRKKPIEILLEDGRKADAEFVGWEKSNDMALLKITDEKANWPSVVLASGVPEGASVCFHYAHTGGYQKSRPAQLRTGRIRSRKQIDGMTRFIISDASVQPGDSGGPLFDIDGRLIGFCIAAGPIGVNRFSAIDNFHRAFEKLKEGGIWGNPEEAQLDTTPRKIDPLTRLRVMSEFERRIKDRYPPVMDLVMAKAGGGAKAKVMFADIVTNMGVDIPIIMDNVSVTYGLDDPALVAQLEKLPEGAVLPIPIQSNGKIITYGVPATERHLVVKLSELGKIDNLKAGADVDSTIALTLAGIDEEWDLALLELAAGNAMIPVKWPEQVMDISAGTGLMSPDTTGRLCWGIASDQRRPIKNRGRIGPMLDESRVSSHRAPYPSVIRHNLPLYAKHAGMPVYTLKGELVGLHMGRICRTLGLIVDIHDIHGSVKKMLENPTVSPHD